MNEKQYGDRSPRELDRAGGYYTRHLNAMTAESLHSKADIAAELAWRDAEIDRLRAAPVSERVVAAAQAVIDRWNSPKWEWHKQCPTGDLMQELASAIVRAAAAISTGEAPT